MKNQRCERRCKDAERRQRQKMTREVEMKKLLITMLLGALQSACSIQAPQPVPQNTLLSFADLAAEISVTHKIVGAVAEEGDLSVASNEVGKGRTYSP
jgi:hypothetical protein